MLDLNGTVSNRAAPCAIASFQATADVTFAPALAASDTPGPPEKGFISSAMVLSACPAQVGALPGPPANVKNDFVNVPIQLPLFAGVLPLPPMLKRAPPKTQMVDKLGIESVTVIVKFVT